jgi:hypothetical protein
MKAKELPPIQRLQELFVVDALSPTGLRRLIAVSHCPAGAVAGGDSGCGYWKVSVDGQPIHVHRIVFALHYGCIPDGHMISHINGDGYDNSIENLRITGYGQGTRTRRKRDKSLCLPKGVSKVGRYYRAQIYTLAGTLSKRGSLAVVTAWAKLHSA